mgnify:CR=1 FL=1
MKVALGQMAVSKDSQENLSACLGLIDQALRHLHDEVIHLRGPNDEDYLDLADSPGATHPIRDCGCCRSTTGCWLGITAGIARAS